MKKILVIGKAGAGKSTFSRKLAGKLGLPLVHLDQLYWCGNWEHRTREEFDCLLQQELEKPGWVIDGNFSRTFPHRLKYCDTIFYFDLPALPCLWGITKRIFTNYGMTRQDMGGNCPEYFDRHKIGLVRGILDFDKKHRTNYYRLLSEATGVQVVVFRTRKQAENYLKNNISPQNG